MKREDGEAKPPCFIRAEKRWIDAATALLANPDDRATRLVADILISAFTSGTKQEAVKWLKAENEDTRKEIAATFSVMQQFVEQAMVLCTSVAVGEGDSYARGASDGTANMYLGEGEYPEGGPKDGEAYEGPEFKKIKNKNKLPPEVQLLTALAEALGGTVEVGVFGADSNDDGIARLQDEYGDIETDPIAQIARKLDKMPGAKRPRLPKKPLPEC